MKPDKDFIKRRFARRLPDYHRTAQVQKDIAAELASLFGAHAREAEIGTIYEAGAGTGFLTGYLKTIHPDARFVLNDLTDAAQAWLDKLMEGRDFRFIAGDAEQVPVPQGVDAVVSASTVQWFADLPGFLTRTAGATTPGGFLALSTYGPDNFREIREITGKGLIYYTKKQLGETVAAAGYELIHLSERLQTLYFDTPVEVLRHIRATGVNAVTRSRWNRAAVADFGECYRRAFLTEEGGLPLTYHPLFVIARKP